MSTTHGQPGLSSDQRSTIRSTILSTRHTLEAELRRQLEKYGIYEDKQLPLENLTHLSVEEIETRRTLDAAIERELESTEGDLERSITNYVREATKTYLNRYVALKTIEVRGLIEETITERPEYGNRSYMHHTVAEIAGELTNAPDDGFGATLDLAYQEIGAEIRMIFEESEHTAIDLDPQVREEILDELDAIDNEAWESDEALGWVYQYFGEEEREEIDERVDEENYKIAGTDIATKTQLFTPRYIVEWMVDNSLGRLWLEMNRGRTSIADEDHCFYLAPLEESLIDRDPKPVEEITVLDPACGSGHMLFYAFDVLYQMYLEEGEVPEKYIPREILRNNLYGVDIDSGAAQIAALSLYLKAKDKSPDVEIPQLNIVSADAVLINGERKEEVLERTGSELEREILEQIWNSFGDIRELGSLVQVEDRIDEVLDEYREEFGATGQAQFTSGGGLTSQSTFVTGGEEESWDEIKFRLMQNVQDLASAALEHNDPIEEMFAAEVGKTVELLDVLIGQYDTVVSNPPYLQSKKMGETLKDYIRDHYVGKYDIYGAFIERCLSFSSEDGHVSMVTPENFMFLYYFRGLRKKLLNECYFIEAAHLSRYGFEQQKDAYTIPFVLRGSVPSEGEPSRFYRMTHEQEHYKNYERKIAGLREIAEALRSGEEHDDVYAFSQNRIDDIGRRPFLYWFGEETLDLFSEHPTLEDTAEVVVGLQTGDDETFVRKWWEIPKSELNKRYKRFQKSGTNSEYYDYAEDYVDWGNSGQDLRDAGANLRNEGFYFDEGVSFRAFGNYFVGRKQQEGSIFSHKSHAVFSDDISDELLLANLNSTLHRFIGNGLNPGLSFEVGDAKRFPVKTDYEYQSELVELVSTGIQERKELSQLTETSADFDGEKLTTLLESNSTDLQYAKEVSQARILTVHGISDTLLFDEYEISPETQEQMYANLPKNASTYPVDRNIHVDYAEFLNEYLEVTDLNDERIDSAVETLRSLDGVTLREAAEETELSPLTVAQLRYDYDLYTDDEKTMTAGQVVSLIVGSLFGRWESITDIHTLDDEILAFDHSATSITNRFSKALNELFQDPTQAERTLESALGDQPVNWLRESFFQHHHVEEYKPRGERSPIYWQLESPNGGFSCFVYYHEIDSNTLPKLRGQYLDPRIEKLENELETLNAQTSGDNPNKELLKRQEEVQNDLDDIKEFRDTIDEMIDDGVTVDVEKGIWENIKKWDQYEVLETGLPKLKSSYSR
ncbi:BREX-1 system adenine-specific DNA-methyltransferase PglX [Natrialbaceae archaeon AArc-T1-2]|uniref:BREX-1 system adenine-specific DNA-methyltransferase PglX n=1 Tax=Natrialbaceae archaeon AArc-T1-2 TaxID=3053904 RepID=UPI00255B194C|nr:BREX-1 system adenine-specific DNA-methyltransferase PglX [Natrialbaceae archaeon AArc-T1-2]WIV67353.1 BREX-1 system adenine-specific DNA-methyltransferase PglX [Natrialbaceae archaeon AArc-T1-2]